MAAKSTQTAQLRLFLKGDRTAGDALTRELEPQLREIAVRVLRKEKRIVPLVPTELVNEFWVNSLAGGGFRIEDRSHFYAIACRIMRRILVDMARKRLTGRRGAGTVPLSLNEALMSDKLVGEDTFQIVQVGELMDSLVAELPASACIIEMRSFVGFSDKEVAEEMGLTERQVRRHWEKGMEWLRCRLRAPRAKSSEGKTGA
jgi:RNA polymerase sigma factor (TIGR02999 family)